MWVCSHLESPLAAVEAVKEAGGRPGVMGWVADFRESFKVKLIDLR